MDLLPQFSLELIANGHGRIGTVLNRWNRGLCISSVKAMATVFVRFNTPFSLYCDACCRVLQHFQTILELWLNAYCNGYYLLFATILVQY